MSGLERHTPSQALDLATRGAGNEVASASGIRGTPEHVVALCVEVIEPCALATVTAGERDRTPAVIASDATAATWERLQFRLGQGPAVDVLGGADMVCSRALSEDTRWPRWRRRPVAAGLLSLVCIGLTADDGRTVGTLSLYAASVDAFGEGDVQALRLVTAHACAAVVTSRRISQLTEALESRTLIGQATGILVERFALSPAAAFAVLRRASQDHNLKLRHVAAHLVETGTLLDGRGPLRAVEHAVG